MTPTAPDTAEPDNAKPGNAQPDNAGLDNAEPGDSAIGSEQARTTKSSRLQRTIFLATAIVAVVALIAAGVVWFVLPRETTVTHEWGSGTLTVQATGVDLSIVEAEPTPELLDTITTVVPTSYLAPTPLEISATGDILDAGVTLSWQLPAPLPEAAAATFAYFDEEIDAWVPEYTTISEDRLTVTALVHHLSVWDVFISATEDVVSAFGDYLVDFGDAYVAGWETGSQHLFRFSHDLLGNAAANPVCSSDLPSWVDDTLMSDNVEVDYGLGGDAAGTAAVLLCAGVAEDAELLEVRAAANRGYGFPVTFADGVAPISAGLSGVEPTIASAISVGMSTFFDGATSLGLSPDSFVFATQEYSATFSQQNLRDAAAGRIMEFGLPNIVQVAVSSTLKLAMDQIAGEEDLVVGGILTVLAALENCDLTQLSTLQDPADTTLWLAGCAASFDIDMVADSVEVITSDVDGNRNTAATPALKKVASAVKMLLILSVAQTVVDYLGDLGTESVSSYPAWFVQVQLKPEPPTLEALFGTYTRSESNGFNTFTIGGDGIFLSACSACGGTDQLAALGGSTWDGQCYTVENLITTPGLDHPYVETWLACPAGFGGPGDDTIDRLGSIYRDFAPTWYLRD